MLRVHMLQNYSFCFKRCTILTVQLTYFSLISVFLSLLNSIVGMLLKYKYKSRIYFHVIHTYYLCINSIFLTLNKSSDYS